MSPSANRAAFSAHPLLDSATGLSITWRVVVQDFFQLWGVFFFCFCFFQLYCFKHHPVIILNRKHFKDSNSAGFRRP